MDKSKEDITHQECEITTFDLRPTTKGQEVEDLDNSIASMKAILDKEVGKKREYKKEIERLKEYIQYLTKPFNQGNAIATLLKSSQEAIENFEQEKVTARETKEWMASKREEAATFVDRLMLMYGQTSSLLSRIVSMVEA